MEDTPSTTVSEECIEELENRIDQILLLLTGAELKMVCSVLRLPEEKFMEVQSKRSILKLIRSHMEEEIEEEEEDARKRLKKLLRYLEAVAQEKQEDAASLQSAEAGGSIPVKATVANDSLLIGSPEPLLGHRKRKFMDPRIGWIALACVLLLGSCCVMITAWYLHLKFEHKWNLPLAIFISWLIAGVEYILQVPANRIGHTSGELSSAQLRAIAEVLIILAFIGFSSVVLREPLLINHVVGFAIVVAGVWLVLLGPFKQVLYHRKDSSDITILDANNTIRVNTTAMEA